MGTHQQQTRLDERSLDLQLELLHGELHTAEGGARALAGRAALLHAELHARHALRVALFADEAEITTFLCSAAETLLRMEWKRRKKLCFGVNVNGDRVASV